MSGPNVDVVWDPPMQLNPMDCWDYSIELACLKGPEDLQLAAELGKTLLERNKELENIIKIHQTTIEEQAQEIEYMKKQTAALREVNDSRLKIYEQLEVSIQDLERANHRLAIENSSDKKMIKSQGATIESLESRCEELQKKIDDLNAELETLLRQQSANQSPVSQSQASWKATVTPGGSIHQNAAPNTPRHHQEANADANGVENTNEEEMTELLRQLQEARSQRVREQKKVVELGQQLATLLLENSTLEEQVNVWRSKAQDVKSLQEEINTLEEVRQGQLCGRCLRSVDNRTHDEISVMLDQEEYDDISMAESLINVNQRDTETLVQDPCNNTTGVTDELDYNPYRVLVEKYQALLDVQRHSAIRQKNSNAPTSCMSLQEELEMSGEFNCFHNPSLENEIQQDTGKSATVNGTRVSKNENNIKKPFSATPTDFSEAETSSSGFSDEISNKTTQTEGRPGSFLCSIADGEDCKFSIYDDNSPFESRFRKTPEYREIFSQIFSVLKRAAEAKDEGEKLPLLGDSTNDTSSSQNQSTLMPQEDVPSETTDDNQSVMSSVISSVVSEPPYRMNTPIASKPTEEKHEDKSDSNDAKNEKTVIGKLQNGTLDYLSVNVQIRKRSGKKNAAKKLFYNERLTTTTANIIPTTNPKVIPQKSNSGGKRKYRPLTPAEENTIWNGQTQYHYSNRTKQSPSGRKIHTQQPRQPVEPQNNSFDYGQYKPSTASEDVARLRRLEMSYAEALRMPNKTKQSQNKCQNK